MRSTKLTRLGLGISLVLATISLLSETTDDAVSDKTIVIIGDLNSAQNLAGSGSLVDSKQLDNEVITDINQALKTVPGIYIREEDGFGLRPNIGIRAASGERSARITLMEDGVLIAPAPYASPSAYYFPNTMRMSFIEVMKGAPLLRHGPYTTGGILNLVSTAIPEQNSGKITVSGGSHKSSNMHAYYGGTDGNFGWLLDGLQRHSDGFKRIDRSNRDSGYDISDLVTKLRWQSNSGPKQDVLLKVQRSIETSNETYLGLSEADFLNNPNRRYGISEIDQMTNDHTGISVRYGIELNENFTLTTQIYRNEFTRDWFKLSGGSRIISDANNGDATAQGVLNGTVDTTGLQYKHNAREYLSEGIEVNLNYMNADHDIQIGMRSHEDEEDRFQPVEIFDQINGSLVYVTTNQPSSSNNRIGSAEALSFWITDQWRVSSDMNVNMALRYEDVDSSQIRYGDIARTTVSARRSNSISDWMPGVSATYNVAGDWQLLAGIHKGFSPIGAGATENETPETSTNWEFGGRYQLDNQFLEVIAFTSDFDNKEERCSVGTPCSDGATAGRFVTGSAKISGLEIQYHNIFEFENMQIPLDIAYTYTDAQISANNIVSGVMDGDRIRDIPENTLSVRFGLEMENGWNHYAVYKYLDESCSTVGCNRTNNVLSETESLSVFDWVSRYALTDNVDVFFKVENVFDEQAIVSRVPDGPRPNLPRTTWIGLEIAI